MPIKNLTNNQDNPAAGMRRIAIIKKGAMEGNRPIDLDHFRLVWADDDRQEADPDIELVRIAFYELYGAEPTRFDNVYFLNADPESAFWLEEWLSAGGAGKLARRCDGETQKSHYDFNKKVMLHNPVPCIQGQEEGCKCTPVGRLSFILKDVVQRTGVLGYFQLQIGGKHEIVNISAHLTNIQRMVNAPLFMIPFSIFRQDQAVNVPGILKRVNKSLVHVQANLQAMQNVIQIGYQEEQPLELETGELPLEVSDMIEGEIAPAHGVDFGKHLSGKRPKSMLERAELAEIAPRPFATMDTLGMWLRNEAAHMEGSEDLISEGQAINIGKELSMIFRNNDVRAFFYKVMFGIVRDKDGHLSKYMSQGEFKAIKKWKNLAEIPASVFSQEVEMIIAAYHAADPDPLGVE